MEETDTSHPAEGKNKEQQEDQEETLQKTNQELQEIHPPQAFWLYTLKQGLILGLVYIALSAIMYGIGPGAVLEWETQIGMWSMFLLSLGFVIFMGIRFQRTRDYGLSFWQAWTYSYVIFNGGLLLSLLWNLLLSTVIDPDIGNKIVNEAIARHPVMSKDAVTEASTRHEMGLFFKPQGLLIKWLTGLGGYALLSLLSGIIIRRKQTPS